MPTEQNKSPSPAAKVSTSELLAIATETAALARAGLPLEGGLRTVSGDVPRRLRAALGRLADRLEAGAALPEAIEAAGHRLTPVLRAVIASGMRARRLPAVVEQFVEAVRWRLELRRLVSSALIYPLVVLLLACCVMLLVTAVVGVVGRGFESLRLPLSGASPQIVRWSSADWVSPGWMILVVAVVILLCCGLLVLLPGFIWRRMGPRGRRIPIFGKLLADAQVANFTGLWRVLAEQDVPTADALRLLADATENRPLASQSLRAAQLAQSGAPLSRVVDALASLPASVRWSVAIAGTQGQLASALARHAELYRQRVAAQAVLLRTIIPALFVAAIAGTATLASVLLLFYPWTTLLHELAEYIG
ncbi:MAG: type II secretion system F family protein [Pirellulales bacterium]